MSEIIKFDDIREGDIVRFCQTHKITSVLEGLIRSEGQGRWTRRWLESRNVTIELIDRPLNLPQKFGSVILIRDEHGCDKARWFLTVEGWTSTAGITKTDEALARFIKNGSFVFDVVA